MTSSDIAQFQKITQRLLTLEKEEPVVEPIEAQQLFHQLDLSLNDEAMEEGDFYNSLEKLVFNTPRTATNRFFNQLYGGRKSKATLGDLIAVLLNTSMYTYKVAGPMVGIEKIILREICNLVGYGENSNGTIASGGSMSNMMAMIMARDAANKSVVQEGVRQEMIVYTSAESHYSIEKNAALIGIGKAQVRFVPTNEKGIMISGELEKLIQEDINSGALPFFVNVTAGTTVMGSFDEVISTSAICKKYNLWLHVDGAYCGSVIFSKKYKHLLEGIEKADSFSVNAHKMLGTPLTCSILLSKDKQHLNDSFSKEASYLYQTDDDDFNLGKTSLQCGRRNDALKFWTLWKSIGTKGLEKLVDHQFELGQVARDYIRSNNDYKLYSFDESISVCFNYKDIPPQKLCTLLYEKAQLMVGFGSSQGEEFIRFVTINADNSKEELLNFFKVLESFVEEYEEELIESVVS